MNKIINFNLSVRKIKILSEDFVHRIVEFSGGYFKEDELSNLFFLIENEAKSQFFTHSSESNLLRFISGTYDKLSFLSDCLKYPHYIELLISITSNSNYLTDIIVRNPEYFYLIANPSNLEKSVDEKEYPESVAAACLVFNSFGSKLNALRRFKRKEILRIGARDIFLKKDMEEITRELSYLAKAIAAELFSLCYKSILGKYHLDLSKKRFCLVSLGKLGGNELNYSSDIDLIIFYDQNEILSNKKEFQEILTEAALLFIESASSLTENGYIYRVDFRLRPDGKNSPLCRQINDYLIYYESRGEDWERQMLIKSDFISGSYELFEKFKKYLTPFIFPVSFKTSPVEQIRKLKSNIEKNLKDEANIKLVPGGIRDIEFSVQALQLINGGRIESLRTGNTIAALRELQNNNLLTINETKILMKAYKFYRKIEHYLQLMNDTQTHLIPSKGELLDRLSHYLVFPNVKSFLQEVDVNRKQVLKIYRSVTGKNEAGIADTIISDIKFSKPRTAERDMVYLKEGKGLLGNKEFDKQSIEAFDKISGPLIKFLKNSDDPDIVLNNFARVITQAKFPSIWYDEFRDNNFFKAFLTICEFSQSTVDLFSEDKTLREIFLSKRIFGKVSIREDITYKEFIFLLTAQFTLGFIKPEKVSTLLSGYFEKRIKDISSPLNENPDLYNHYLIGAMGSMGSGEMTFASDIDLIFITDNLKDHSSEQKIFMEFLNKLREEFKPVAVDCRLRPEGKSGLLVWDVNSYVNYIISRARIWELQALTKLRFIAGNKKIFNTITRAVIKRITNEKPDRIKSELMEMRKKMLPAAGGFTGMLNIKKNSGGITDIEFILQYFILCNPHLFQKFRAKNIKAIIKGLVRLNPETGNPLSQLVMNHQFLKSLILLNQNIFHQSSSIIIKDEFKFAKLAKRMGYKSELSLEKKLHQVMKDTSYLFTKFYGK